MVDFVALKLTVQLAGATTVILGVVGVPLAYWLAQSRWRGKFLVESVITLPLVLPPTVLGFYLLLALGPRSPIGKLWDGLVGSPLPFSFPGILLASLIANLPFAVRPFLAAFVGLNRRWLEASWCLGESYGRTFWRVTLPVCWPGILSGLVLTFAHSVGEFGVVLMVGGNIPEVTRTLSISLYDDVQALDYGAAQRTAAGLLAFSLLVLCSTHLLGRRGMPL
ncbi:MAG: molybdate ABC transporter permease subunit [Pirellulales bacterium]